MADPGVLDTMTGSATLDEIGTMLEEMWSVHHHVPSSVRTQVAIAVNIIEHAAQHRPVRLRMEVHVSPEEVRVAFLDDGPPAAVDLKKAAMPDAMAESGRGTAHHGQAGGTPTSPLDAPFPAAGAPESLRARPTSRRIPQNDNRTRVSR